MEVKVKVQLTTKEMFEFLMRHTYFSISGIIGLLLSLAAFAGFFYALTVPGVSNMYLVALLLIGLLFTVIQPWMIYSKAKSQVKRSEAINKPLEYTINKSGIDIKQDNQTASGNWDSIYKICSTKNLIMLYTGRMHAYILPKKDIGEQMEDLRTIVKENCTAGYIKM